jgi:hypothetical protein
MVLGTDILGALMTLASLVGLVGFWGIQLKQMSRPKSS